MSICPKRGTSVLKRDTFFLTRVKKIDIKLMFPLVLTKGDVGSVGLDSYVES